MNRPIKFRAFHKTWRSEDGSGMQGVKGLWWGNSGVGHVHLSEWADSTLLSDVELMQFTGLLDKNGVEICEGDIVKHREAEVGKLEVQFWQGQWIGMAFDTAYQPLWEPLSMSGKKGYERNTDLEVIGNIHENPELITK